MGRRRLVAATVLALCVAGLAAPELATAVAPASVPTSAGWRHQSRPTAAVSLGDSYISGEAGRWKGNAVTSSPGLLGTDRAWRPDPADPSGPGLIDPSLVYGESAVNGCHRSDVAPIQSALLLVQKRINLACSGAATVNVLRASAGGVGFKGEQPQDDQLAAIARSNQVKLVVLSIGGNDLGFGSVLQSCIAAYLLATTPCSVSQQAAVNARLPVMAAAVGATVDDVRATMAAAGYRTRDYRLILQSYPTPVPDPAQSRYSGAGPDQRATLGGCPLLDVDSAWTHDTLSPAVSAALAGVAHSRGAQFLDLTEAFRGHELCAADAQQSTGKPRSGSSEWIRFIDLTGQGDSSEWLHPNYFGQQALGQCLTLAALTSRDAACHGVPKLPSWAVYLS